MNIFVGIVFVSLIDVDFFEKKKIICFETSNMLGKEISLSTKHSNFIGVLCGWCEICEKYVNFIICSVVTKSHLILYVYIYIFFYIHPIHEIRSRNIYPFLNSHRTGEFILVNHWKAGSCRDCLLSAVLHCVIYIVCID